jgi:endoglucanase
MHRGRLRAVTAALLAVAVVGMSPVVSSAARKTAGIDPSTSFFIPPPNPGAVQQISDLRAAGDRTNADLLQAMVSTPQAVWVEAGTPVEVKKEVKRTMRQADRQGGTLPVLVLYNIPFRDCAQFSAGGATSAEEYLAWVDGVARGIGRHEAMIILEPDGLGIIPWYTNINNELEWCQPDEADPETAAEDRFAMLNEAVDRLNKQPGVNVYLDATHSAWLGVGDASDRLVKAGLQRAAGFFLNVSNYRLTEHLQKYGTWISSCVAFANNPEEGGWRLGHYEWCASQYHPADPNDFSTWHLTDKWYADNLGTAAPTTQFVVDTSRNGQGPWTPPAGVYPDAQDWCNPPGRGLGLRPTADTGDPLIDAYLWVKTPGESDGECTRGLGPSGTVDPEWGQVDPGAGQWFPAQALQLVQLAVPPLEN